MTATARQASSNSMGVSEIFPDRGKEAKENEGSITLDGSFGCNGSLTQKEIQEAFGNSFSGDKSLDLEALQLKRKVPVPGQGVNGDDIEDSIDLGSASFIASRELESSPSSSKDLEVFVSQSSFRNSSMPELYSKVGFGQTDNWPFGLNEDAFTAAQQQTCTDTTSAEVKRKMGNNAMHLEFQSRVAEAVARRAGVDVENVGQLLASTAREQSSPKYTGHGRKAAANANGTGGKTPAFDGNASMPSLPSKHGKLSPTGPPRGGKNSCHSSSPRGATARVKVKSSSRHRTSGRHSGGVNSKSRTHEEQTEPGDHSSKKKERRSSTGHAKHDKKHRRHRRSHGRTSRTHEKSRSPRRQSADLAASLPVLGLDDSIVKSPTRRSRSLERERNSSMPTDDCKNYCSLSPRRQDQDSSPRRPRVGRSNERKGEKHHNRTSRHRLSRKKLSSRKREFSKRKKELDSLQGTTLSFTMDKSALDNISSLTIFGTKPVDEQRSEEDDVSESSEETIEQAKCTDDDDDDDSESDTWDTASWAEGGTNESDAHEIANNNGDNEDKQGDEEGKSQVNEEMCKPTPEMVTISPGVEMPMRESDETTAAICGGSAKRITCVLCQVEMFCVPDAAMVLCPECKSINNCSGMEGKGIGVGVKAELVHP